MYLKTKANLMGNSVDAQCIDIQTDYTKLFIKISVFS